jgi:predicted O-methyltransferase YrrM
MGLSLQVQQVLAELEAFGRANDQREPDRARKMLNLERETAELLRAFVLSARRKRVLEIGTSNGYSAIWLASTLQSIPGSAPLLTIEKDAGKAQSARTNLQKAGLADHAVVLEGSATDLVSALPGPFDCVFFDADRISAPEQLRLLLPKLTADALLLADNVLSHPEEIAGYLKEFAGLPDFVTTTVPVGKGLHVAVRSGTAR